jgi:ATP-dependent DNA helicase RecG
MTDILQTLSPDLPEEQVILLAGPPAQTKLAEHLVGMANAAGGALVLGLDPKSGTPVGLADPEETLDRILKAALSIEPPLIIPMPRQAELEGVPVLIVLVPPGLPHVYSYKGKYLVSRDGQTHPLPPRQLQRLMMERGAVSFESTAPEGARVEDLDWDRVDAYIAGLSGLRVIGREATLLHRGSLIRDGKELRPTRAGLLLFGRDPQCWMPSAGILVARYAGTTMDDHFVKEEIRGTLPDQIRQAEAFVVSNMRRGVRLQALERAEEPEYPIPAVREAIVNAVAHRDYQIRGDGIRILLFSDRLEFYSPGRLPGHVTIQNLVHERFSRNEALVQVLADMGFIERLGYGVDRIIRLMAQAGLPPPRFQETAAGFQVTLVGPGRDLIGQNRDQRSWRHLGLNPRQEAALTYLAETERITNREFQELCPDVSAETIRRDLADMVSRNILLKIGEKRATYYIFK